MGLMAGLYLLCGKGASGEKERERGREASLEPLTPGKRGFSGRGNEGRTSRKEHQWLGTWVYLLARRPNMSLRGRVYTSSASLNCWKL